MAPPRTKSQRPAGPRGTTPPIPAVRQVPRTVLDTLALIDAAPHPDGEPEALSYFNVQKTEPSRGMVDLRIVNVIALDGSAQLGFLTLEVVMHFMLSHKVAFQRDNFLVVGHGNISKPSPGLLMPIMAGAGVASSFGENLAKISRLALDRAEGEALLADQTTPKRQKLGKWKDFFRKLGKHGLAKDADVKALEKKIDDGLKVIDGLTDPKEQAKQLALLVSQVETSVYVPWRDAADNGAICGITRAQLNQLLALRDNLRKQQVARLEIRACDVGQNPKGMRQLGQFLGVQEILGPDVEGMYGNPSVVQVGGRLPSSVQNFPPPSNTTKFFPSVNVAVTITEPSIFQYDATLFSRTRQAIQSWSQNFAGVTQSVSSANLGNLVLAGLHDRGQQQGFPYIFPQEPSYRTHIQSVRIDLTKLDDWDF